MRLLRDRCDHIKNTSRNSALQHTLRQVAHRTDIQERLDHDSATSCKRSRDLEGEDIKVAFQGAISRLHQWVHGEHGMPAGRRRLSRTLGAGQSRNIRSV